MTRARGRIVNCVPIDQEGVAKEGLKTIMQQLQAGRAVLVFPEGERTVDGLVHELKPGIHLLIKRVPTAHSDIPITYFGDLLRTSGLPAPGETLIASGCHLGFGGKGANQAVAAAHASQSCCDATNEKIDRMFKRSVSK